jgi:DNA (cytosine-5)-methyltransferase 1
MDNFLFEHVAGHMFKKDIGSKAMGIDWMTKDELAEAIPPAYTEFIGKFLLEVC